MVLGAATGLVCALFWSMVKAFDSILIEPASDVSGTIGWLYQLRHEGGYHLFGTTHHTLTGAPFGWDASNGLNINWLLPYYPAYLLTKVTTAVGAYNVVLLAGYVLSGAAMYMLVRYLGCGRLVAAWAGLVYIAFPWHLMRVPHASLVHLEFFPLLLFALVAALRNPTLARFLLVGATTLACWLTSGYFGAMAVVIAAAFALGVLLTRTAGIRRVRYVGLATLSALAGTLIVAVLAHAAGVGRDAGLDRPVADVYSWGVHLDELVIPAARNFVFGDWSAPYLATRQHGSYPVETTNYLGILTIALAAAWVVFAWRRGTTLDARKRVVTPALVSVAAIALLLSLPGRVSVLGHTLRMPSWLFWRIVPAFRVPSRWSVIIETALVPLAAFALQQAVCAAQRDAHAWRGRALGAAVVAAAMIASFLELGFNPTTHRLSMNDEPPEYAALQRTSPGILAVYPLVPRLDYLLWQTRHGRSMLNTYAFGSAADDAQHALVNPGAPGTAQQLSLLGVKTIITNGDALRWSTLQRPNPRTWGPGYRLVARTNTGASTWQVVAKPGPAFVAAVSGFGPPEPLPDGTPVFPLISSSGVAYLTIRAKEPGVVRLSFDATPPRGGRRVLRLADDSRERRVAVTAPTTHLSTVVAVPRGVSLLLVKTDPAPQSRADAIVISRLQAERTVDRAQLSALLQDGEPGF